MTMACATDLSFGVKILLALRKLDVESHLVVSAQTKHDIEGDEAGELAAVHALADYVYSEDDLRAVIAQDGFQADAAIVLSCDGKRLASIATGPGNDLTSRTAHLMLEKHGNLVLMFGDSPYIAQHIKDLVSITKSGGLVFLGVSTFSAEMQTMDESAAQLVRSVLETPLHKARGSAEL
jgi:flavin prenyltransferase